VKLVHVLQPLALVIIKTFSNMCSTMAIWLRNALLILHYPKVICTVLCSYVGAVLINKNELISDNVKRNARARKA